MNDEVYRGLCEIIYNSSRMHMTPEKKSLLTSRLSHHKRLLQAQDWDAYLEKLKESSSADEIECLIDLAVTNHTYFFREPAHFERLPSEYLDEKLNNFAAIQKPIQCWSVASSSGEEAFSLAITLAEYSKRYSTVSWKIYGTDISRRIIEKAKNCIYKIELLNLPDEDFLSIYFRRGSGVYDGYCKVKENLLKDVEFFQANVFQEILPVPDRLDLIFCRNILIYFDFSSRQQLISRLENMLEPGGLLFIGQTENLFNIRHNLQSLGGGIFRRSN